MAGQYSGQIIGGQSYRLYTPEWYAARERQRVQDAKVGGEATGTGAGTAIQTLRGLVPDLFGGNSSSSSSSSGSNSQTAPRVEMGGGGGGVNLQVPGGVPGGGVPSGYMPQSRLAVPDMTAADDAQFNRVKDKVGQSTKGAITGLRSALASRGQLGGGGEFKGTESIIGRGLGEIGDLGREQIIQGSQRNAETAALDYTGGITQRGQDMSAQQAADALAARLAETQYQGNITQRGQDLAASQNAQSFSLAQQQSQQNLLDKLINALSGFGGY